MSRCTCGLQNKISQGVNHNKRSFKKLINQTTSAFNWKPRFNEPSLNRCTNKKLDVESNWLCLRMISCFVSKCLMILRKCFLINKNKHICNSKAANVFKNSTRSTARPERSTSTKEKTERIKKQSSAHNNTLHNQQFSLFLQKPLVNISALGTPEWKFYVEEKWQHKKMWNKSKACKL